MIWTILLNMLCGFIFLVPLVFVLPNIASVVGDPSGQPLPVILRDAIGNEGGAFALTVPLIILGIFCGEQSDIQVLLCAAFRYVFNADDLMY